MTTQQNENIHRILGYVNTLLLGVTVFFVTRMVDTIDRLSDNVVTIRVEMAKVQAQVGQNTDQIRKIQESDIKPSKFR